MTDCLFRTTIWLIMCSSLPLCAQSRSNLTVRVAGNADVRSPSVAVRRTERLEVRLVGTDQAKGTAIRVFVHAVNGDLVGVEDPDSTESSFRWSPDVTGKYYVLLRNTTNVAARVVITVTSSTAGERGSTAPSYAAVRVFYATDREQIGSSAERAIFGTEPAPTISFGYADVSIPRDHRLGELEGPSIFKLQIRSDPEKHVSLLVVKPERKDEFFDRISDRVLKSKRHEALVFIHGFNVAFEDATRRAAQISYDLGFDGATVLFSWPSQGSVMPVAYRKDERNAQLSVENLARLLEMLAASSPNIVIHVVAHSMGNRVLAGALQRLSTPSKRSKRRVGEVALFAPDIDTETFRRSLGEIAGKATRLTLYASSGDAALKISENINGYPRAGESGPHMIIAPGLDTIDASDVDTSLLGVNHSYYADNATILSDLFSTVRGTPPKDRFRLTRVAVSSGVYWRFRPAVH